MKIRAKLAKIQQALNVPKSNYNEFGKYKYRSCEDILEAVKPLLNENKTALLLNDELVLEGGRFYVKATATLIDTESEESISNTAYAREDEVKKGMDGSQITGACSSYARKYALNGLFLIDDVKDADTMDNREKPEEKKPEAKPKPEKKRIGEKEVAAIIAKCKKEDVDISKVCAMYKVKGLTDFSEYQYKNLQENWTKVRDAAKGEAK